MTGRPPSALAAPRPGTDPVAARVADARRQAGMTQRELASAVGVSLWTLERLEQGDRDPRRHLDAVARATGRSEAWFVSAGEPAREPAADTAPAIRSRPPGRPPSFAARLRGAIRTAIGSRSRAGSARPGISGTAEAWHGSTGAVGAPAPREERPAGPGDGAPAQTPLGPPSERPSLTGRNLVLASIAVLVLIRFFTEVVPVVPRAANFVDVPIFAGLLLAAGLAGGSAAAARRRTARVLVPALVFLLLCAVSALANPSRVAVGPVIVFLYGFMAPLGVYYATYRLWPPGQALSLSRLLVWLGLVQFAVVAVIDLPKFLAGQNPDDISGTFGTNAYQLVFFLLVFAAVLAGISTFEHRRTAARLAPLLFVATLAVVFLAQYRALLVTSGLAVLLIAAALGSARIRGLVAGALLVLAFLVTLNYTSQAFPALKFASTVDALRADPGAYAVKRLAVFDNVLGLYDDDPRYVATGTGPGTFSSRAWQTFAHAGSSSGSNVAGGYVSQLTGGRLYATDVSDRYVEPTLRDGEVIGGSRALTSPFASYSSVLAEVGLLGLIVIVGVYLGALAGAVRMAGWARAHAMPGDPLPALIFGAVMGLFVLLQMGVLGNWLEVTRITFITWALLAVATKEFHARHASVPA